MKLLSFVRPAIPQGSRSMTSLTGNALLLLMAMMSYCGWAEPVSALQRPVVDDGGCLCEKNEECEVTVNVADFFGNRKGNIEWNRSAPWEVGWHARDGGSEATLTWLGTPPGRVPRIVKHHTNMYSIWSKPGRIKGYTRGVALWALHSMNDYDFSGFDISHCKDCIMWMQAPVGFPIVIDRYIKHLDVGRLDRNELRIKLSVFNLTIPEEVLSEVTTSLEYCYERK